MRTIEITNVADFLGHQPTSCEICNVRLAAVLMIARDELRVAKAHVCPSCFEIAEQSNFEIALESVSPQDFREIEPTPFREPEEVFD